MSEKVEIFFSYSHKDEDLCEQLMAHLSFLKWEGLTIDWYDRKIGAGEEWAGKINEHLNMAHIILLLISSDFIKSDYCCDIEMKRAMARQEAGEARVIPILLRPAYWQNMPFAQLQALPNNGKFVTSWPNRDEAFLDIARSIRKVVEEQLQQSTSDVQVSVRNKHSTYLTETLRRHLPPTSAKSEPLLPETESGSDRQILTPSLTILLGGTAALVGLDLMEHMLTLTQVDRNHISLIYIDTDDPPDPLSQFRSQHKDLFQEVSLRIAVPTGISNILRVPQGDGDFRYGFMEQHTFIRDKVPESMTNGTGGIRNNGHVAACFSYDSIYNTLNTAIRNFIRLGIEQNRATTEIQANLVAFLGGGTGSSILPDIAVMVRDLLSTYQLRQRINLFCILPEAIEGMSIADLEWYRSNATACLLELIALGEAAGNNPQGYYQKYMRKRVFYLTNDPIANEIYLIGQTAMNNVTDIARIVGMDLFQRTTDGSGVGSLEHAKWVDRRTLGEMDDRGLPTMFGITCPFEVCFPAEETAKVFAQLAATELTCMLTHYLFSPRKVNEPEQSVWSKKWQEVAQLDSHSNSGNIFSKPSPEIPWDDIKNADQEQLDTLWAKLEQYERSAEKWLRGSIKKIRSQEIRQIAETSPQERGNLSLFYQQVQRLKRLDQEYDVVLNDLREDNIPDTLERPIHLEKLLTDQCSLSQLTRDSVISEIHEQYNKRPRMQVKVIRRHLLEPVLLELKRLVQDSLNHAVYLFEGTNTDELSQELKKKNRAWRGLLNDPHPYQRHIFDLPQLRTQGGQNIAIERLYQWATTGEKGLDNAIHIDYSHFIDACVAYLAENDSLSDDADQSEFFYRIMLFFQDFYMRRLQNINLFGLLDIATPSSIVGQSRDQQISKYLLDHLQRIRASFSNHIPFAAELWSRGLTDIDTSIYLGIHWNEGDERSLLDVALDDLGPLTSRGQTPRVEASLDPHRVQITYGQHAISLNTVAEFYREHNSAMEAYLLQQEEWQNGNSKSNRPVHNSSEMERLVWDANALGYKDTEGRAIPLPERVIRHFSF